MQKEKIMADKFAAYTKRNDFLICVDSDGCAMDTMNIKHFRCFGPCMVEEWGLEQWAQPILARWNDINLYTMTRGINRFKGLALALREIDGKYRRIDGVDELERWVANAPALSNDGVKAAIKAGGGEVLSKALSWSMKVNESINAMPFDVKKPFDGVLEHVDILLAQNVGSKAFCIQELLKKGYDKDKVLMTGDAPGDLDAAKSNGVLYYPILVRHEKESWTEFRETAVGKLTSGNYSGTYQQEKIEAFLGNLK